MPDVAAKRARYHLCMAENGIQKALAQGISDDEIVVTIMRESNVDEEQARQILSMEKDEPRENWDDVLPA